MHDIFAHELNLLTFVIWMNVQLHMYVCTTMLVISVYMALNVGPLERNGLKSSCNETFMSDVEKLVLNFPGVMQRELQISQLNTCLKKFACFRQIKFAVHLVKLKSDRGFRQVFLPILVVLSSCSFTFSVGRKSRCAKTYNGFCRHFVYTNFHEKP